MSKEKKRLGRGLSALLSAADGPLVSGEMLETPYSPGQSEVSTFTLPGMGELREQFAPTPVRQKDDGISLEPPQAGPRYELLEVAGIKPNPWQPREEFDKAEIQALAESLNTHGLLQAIVVRRAGAGYQVIAGERRLRAAKWLGWMLVPATVIEASDRDMAELALIENIQRKDLNPVEKAISFQEYLDKHGATQEELAKRLGIDRSTIANFLRLLSLPGSIQNFLRAGKITQGHARAILPLEKATVQLEMCERIMTEELSVRQTEAIVADWLAGNKTAITGGEFAMESLGTATPSISAIPAPEKSSRAKKKSAHIQDMEQQLREALGLKVKLSANPGGRGKLEIFFKNHAEFESLLDYLRGEC